MSKLQKYPRWLFTLAIIMALVLHGSCQEEDTSQDSSTELFHQDIELEKGDVRNIRVPMTTIFSEMPDLSVHKNVIVVEIQNEVLDRGNSPFSHLLDVQAQMNQESMSGDEVDLKDIIIDNEGKDMILHYAVYDLCHIEEDAYIALQVEALDGKFRGFVSVEVVDLNAFSIQCTDKESDLFLPRDHHSSCEAWDSKIWVFGGKKNVKKQEYALNDIMVLDTTFNSWTSIEPKSGSRPSPRYGHAMFCYFQYFVIYGGQDQQGNLLGDLWVFDTVGEKWTFINNNLDSHELEHLGKSTEVPQELAYSGSVMFPELGAGYISGGFTNKGAACNIWGLKMENLIIFVEDGAKSLDNFWIKMDSTEMEPQNLYMCRERHIAAIVGEDSFVVWGGLSSDNTFVKDPYLFNVSTKRTQKLTVEGKQPDPRIKEGVLSTGAKMGILYGGIPLGGTGTYIDIWHFMVVGNSLKFKEIEYEMEGDNLFMTWRHGFTMHYARGIQDPILVGGTFGNNQQSRALVLLPEKKCQDNAEYIHGKCSPCPRGSIYDEGQCKWCPKNSYFKENKNDYFQSQCYNCPYGLVAGYFKSCVPCQGGTIYDINHPDFCRKCSSESICPIGTRFEFPISEYGENFHEVTLNHLPEMFNPHQKHYDHTSAIVLFIAVFCTLVLFIVIAILLSMCKEQTLFIFREMDVPFITGQGTKKVVGGVIMLFFVMIISIITGGFFINFFLFNSKTVMFEAKNPYLERAYPSNYYFKISVTVSSFLDPHDTGNVTESEKREYLDHERHNLCEKQISYSMSRYFAQAKDENIAYTCGIRQLSHATNEYIIELTIKDIRDEAPENAFIRFTLDSDFGEIAHFIRYEYWNIWRYYEDFPISFSSIRGFITPQMTTKSNSNITAAFRGPKPTQLKFRLTPTHYGNEIDSTNFEGYQVYLEDFKKGSTVNKRTIATKETPSGEESRGIDIELFTHVGDTINHVQVLRNKSLLETLTYVLGFTAGFVIIVHLLKYFLSKEEYFRGLDRECDTLFGSANNEMLSLNTMPRSDSVNDSNRFMSPINREEGKHSA